MLSYPLITTPRRQPCILSCMSTSKTASKLSRIFASTVTNTVHRPMAAKHRQLPPTPPMLPCARQGRVFSSLPAFPLFLSVYLYIRCQLLFHRNSVHPPFSSAVHIPTIQFTLDLLICVSVGFALLSIDFLHQLLYYVL